MSNTEQWVGINWLETCNFDFFGFILFKAKCDLIARPKGFELMLYIRDLEFCSSFFFNTKYGFHLEFFFQYFMQPFIAKTHHRHFKDLKFFFCFFSNTKCNLKARPQPRQKLRGLEFLPFFLSSQY